MDSILLSGKRANIVFSAILFSILSFRDVSATLLPEQKDIDALKGTLTGDLYMRNSREYNKGTTLLNTRYSGRPGFIVIAMNTADVQKCVLFAKRYNLRVTVLSSGHDYIGRSIADNTVHISLKRMRAFIVNKTDPTSNTGVSAIVGPGQDWGTIYKTLYHKYGYLAVGGSAPTVSPGGYFLGGGHSPLSPSLGLGVDSILQFEMVTPDGSIVIARNNSITITSPNGITTEEKDSDLFWATRGGGPGAYGIVTSYKIQLHNPPDGFTQLTCSTYIKFEVPGGETLGQNFLNIYGNYMLYNRTSRVGGYIIANNAKGFDKTFKRPYHGSLILVLLHFGNWTQGNKEFEPLYNQIAQRRIGVCSRYNHAKFWDYQKSINDPTGFGAYVINRFMRKVDLNEEFLKLFTDTFLKQVGMTCTGTHLGGGLAATVYVAITGTEYKAPVCFYFSYTLASGLTSISYPARKGTYWFRGKVSEVSQDSSSVSPDFRQAQLSLSCGAGWGNAGDNKTMVDGIRDKFAPELYKFGKGVYVNEPDYALKNWKQEYWGTNYARLLKIKRKWDPKGMLWCHHCVGSDLFSATPSPKWPTSANPAQKPSSSYRLRVLLFVTGFQIYFRL